MKIAHIAPPWITIPPKNYGGTETVLYNLVEEQVAQGHDVTLFAAGDATTSAKLVSFFPHSLLESGVPWQGHLKAYYHLHKAVEYIKDHNFDIVHTHLSSSADMYLFPLMSHLAVPHVMTLHSHFPFDRVQSWTGDADDDYIKDWASKVPMVLISNQARANTTLPLNIAGVVHHGLPPHQFKATTHQPEEYLVWLGRFVPEKGAHIAVEAAKRAGVPIVLAGTIDKHVEESVNYFEQKIKPLIDNCQVKYVGPVNMQQKIDLLSHARGMLNPIQWEEPFGMVMIEAMAVGCPVIAFSRGAAPEIVLHGTSGFLVQNIDEMVHSIAHLSKLERTRVSAHVEQNFTVRVMAQKYVKVYKQVIASSRKEHVASSYPYDVTVALRSPASTSRLVPLV